MLRVSGMQVYLPIAEMSVNILVLLALGGGVGFISGLFGIGGGFLMTPILIFLGVPPAVAVGTQANQLVGASLSGVLSHWQRGGVDTRMGGVMLGGGIVGSALGVWIFGILQRLGQIDAAISILYVLVLGSVGGLMLVESIKAYRAAKNPAPALRRLHQHLWMHGLPWKLKFPKSRLYISVFVPLTSGFLGGVSVAIMGVGGGFFMIPAMVYIVGMPASVVAGTSLFQIIFVTAITALLQAVTNQTVDVFLALILLVGGIIGTQIGVRFGMKLRGEQSRMLMSALILAVAVKLFFDLILTPSDLYGLEVLR